MARYSSHLMVQHIQLDLDAVTFLNAAEITDNTITSAINTLVIGLKDKGLWVKLKAVYPFVGGTPNTHKFNLKDPRDLDAAFRLVFNGSWTHSYTGALPSGLSGCYANTFFNAQSNLTAKDTHLSFYSRTNSRDGDRTCIGANNDGIFELTLWAYHQGLNKMLSLQYDYPTEAVTYDNPARSDGYIIATRTGAQSAALYFRGTKVGSNISEVSTKTIPNLNIYIGAQSQSSTGASNYDNKECAFASIGSGLSDEDAINLYNLVEQFQISLSRQV